MKVDLWKTIAEISLELHPARINAIASKLLKMETIFDFQRHRHSIEQGIDTKFIDRLYEAWMSNPKTSPVEISAALKAGASTAIIVEQRMSVEMVWTGPSTSFQSSRSTEQVLFEVIGSAEKSLFITSFVVYNIKNIIEALRKKVIEGVVVDILLELPESKGGKVSIDSAKLITSKIPDVNVYTWSQNSDKERLTGSVHAKCILADGKNAFISSANLTTAAMEKNMELGVLIRGGNLPKKLEKHFNALKVMGVIKKLYDIGNPKF